MIDKKTQALVVAPRLKFNGLLSDGKQSIAISGIGITAEKKVLLSSAIRIVDGEDLFAEDRSAPTWGKDFLTL
ncbi:hypothetical protein ACL7TT_15655 [Microbulbifer sp. 2304DJ12-6]|uniref:hypothetical protein n=1 Tax=Microbulbifer sp. 2304DJ12-6 TaxID=3233340 RepID=UPI0039AF779E